MKESDFFKDIKPLTKYSKSELEAEAILEDEAKQVRKKTTTVHSIKKTPKYVPLDRDVEEVSSSKKPSSSQGLWVFAVLAIIILAVVVSLKYATAVVEVTPKMKTIPLNETLTLSKGDSALPFETVSVESGTKEEVVLSEKVEKREKATGSITIYNAYNTGGQPLVAQTRFESKDGHVYRLDKAVTVPGYTTIDNKKVPGSIAATVTADGYGEGYNIGESTFSIPGFKGSAQFDSMYATSTASISGGLDGTYYTTKENSTGGSDESTKGLLTEKLVEMVKKQVPDEYVFIEGLYTLDTEDLTSVFSKEAKTEAGIEATLTQIVFPREAFIAYVLTKYPDLSSASILDTTNVKGSVLSSQEKDGNIVYTITLTGDIKQNMPLDGEVIKEKLAGMKKGSFNAVMAESSDIISSAELSIRPFWVYTIPKSFNRIKVINTNDR